MYDDNCMSKSDKGVNCLVTISSKTLIVFMAVWMGYSTIYNYSNKCQCDRPSTSPQKKQDCKLLSYKYIYKHYHAKSVGASGILEECSN